MEAFITINGVNYCLFKGIPDRYFNTVYLAIGFPYEFVFHFDSRFSFIIIVKQVSSYHFLILVRKIHELKVSLELGLIFAKTFQ